MNFIQKALVVLGLLAIISGVAVSIIQKLPHLPQRRASSAPAVKSRFYYIDKTGKVSIDPKLYVREANDFSEGLVLLQNNESDFGYIDKSGKVAIPFRYQGATGFSEGLAGVLINGMCGYIDKSGTMKIPAKFDSVTTFYDGWGLVENNDRKDKCTYVNVKGETIGERFLSCSSFSEGLAGVIPVTELPAESDGQQTAQYHAGFIDTMGKHVIAATFEAAEPFSEGMAAVALKGKWGYINREGKMVIEAQYDHAGAFRDERAAVVVGGKLGFIDPKGNMVIPPQFVAAFDPDSGTHLGHDLLSWFSERFAAVKPAAVGAVQVEKIASSWGYIDKSGRFVIAPKFEEARQFSEGLAAVKLDKKWGYIDQTGKWIIQPQFTKASSFSEGLAAVRR